MQITDDQDTKLSPL